MRTHAAQVDVPAPAGHVLLQNLLGLLPLQLMGLKNGGDFLQRQEAGRVARFAGFQRREQTSGVFVPNDARLHW